MMLNPLQAFVLHEKTFLGLKMAPENDGLVMKSDESSLFISFEGVFWGQGMFFVQNKCLQWIQHHDKPLVRPLTSYLKQIFFSGYFPPV